jgi:hypothetical protein
LRNVRHFKEPVLVTHAEAARFLWGDEQSQHVSDLVYGRGDRISSVTFALSPGGYFKASKAWKPLYDQHRFYYVVAGHQWGWTAGWWTFPRRTGQTLDRSQRSHRSKRGA